MTANSDSSPAMTAKQYSKQEEMLIKRLLFQKDLKLNEKGIKEKGDKSILDDLSEADLNRLGWELVLITTVNVDEEWDHIIVGLDDPNFDWASAKLPHIVPAQMKTGTPHEQTCDLIGSVVADHLSDAQLSLAVRHTLQSQKHNHSLNHRLGTEMCKESFQAGKKFLREAIEMSTQDCSCLKDLLSTYLANHEDANV